MSLVHHRTAEIDGHTVFYREAGPPHAPAVVLLHGYPTSSHMFRGLIPALADRYRVIAPDHLGFGRSDMPSPTGFDYTFDALATVTDHLLDHLGLRRYALYVQDYGTPIGWRLAVAHPERITAIVTQNGNAYRDGFNDAFWAPLWAYAADPRPETEQPVRDALSLDAIRWQYLHGVPDPSLISPDTWAHDHALAQRPGSDEVQLRLFRDYPVNVQRYGDVHAYFRASRPPLLAVWGANDEIFLPAGAHAFARDLPDAEIHLLDAGHFALESDLGTITAHLHDFLGRVAAQG